MSKTAEITAKNRAAWDASAPHHGTGAYWEGLKAGFADPTYSRFDETFREALIAAGIKGARAVQIGCNNGRETLSACAIGAQSCLGVDQSRAFLAQAAVLRDISGHNATFLEADIYALPKGIEADFDLAFITIGVLNWMPDLPRFFATVATLLRPGGQLLIYETHPILDMFDPVSNDPFALRYSYFRKAPFIETAAITYDGSSQEEGPESHWFFHPLGRIVQGCIDAGLSLTRLEEFPHSIREAEYDQYQDQAAQLPMSYLLAAIKS